MKIIIKILTAVLIVSIFFGTFVFLYLKSKKKPVVYDTAQPFITDIILKTVASGSVTPRKEIDIKSKVSGIIETVNMEAGDLVKKGDLIAMVKIIPDMVSLNNAESRLRRAAINYNDAKKTYKRKHELFKKNIINESEFQRFQLNSDNALEELKAAEDNLMLIRDGVSKKYKNNANTSIRSTIDGMILDIPVKVGKSVIESNTFNNGTTIAVVADMSEMIFEGKVDESEVGKIKEGMDLVITVGAIEDETFHAILEYISPKGVEENGAIQFEIKASVELKANTFLRAGYSANADIVLDKREKVMAISESLLQFEKENIFVEVEKAPQIYEKRKVETGLSDSINIEILSGISQNDKVKVWNRILK